MKKTIKILTAFSLIAFTALVSVQATKKSPEEIKRENEIRIENFEKNYLNEKREFNISKLHEIDIKDSSFKDFFAKFEYKISHGFDYYEVENYSVYAVDNTDDLYTGLTRSTNKYKMTIPVIYSDKTQFELTLENCTNEIVGLAALKSDSDHVSVNCNLKNGTAETYNINKLDMGKCDDPHFVKHDDCTIKNGNAYISNEDLKEKNIREFDKNIVVHIYPSNAISRNNASTIYKMTIVFSEDNEILLYNELTNDGYGNEHYPRCGNE